MKKQHTFYIVNCSRIIEGTLKNVLGEIGDVTALSREAIDKSVFFASVPTVTGAAGAGTNAQGAVEKGFDSARSSIALMLSRGNDADPANNQNTKEPAEKKSEGSVKPLNPDLILYQLTDPEETDIHTIKNMRRKCAFRDVPIFIVTTYSDRPKAKKMILHGADDVLIMPASPEEIQKKINSALEPAGSRIPIITKVINPYISATVDLLSTMAGLHAEKKEVFLKKNYRLFGDISAIMSLSGKVEGEVVVCFEERLAREVVSKIMAMQPDQVSKEELKEGIGEVVNIISGNAKATLATTEYSHQISLPAVVWGRGHEIAHPGKSPCIVVIFEVSGQPMAVLVSMTVK